LKITKLVILFNKEKIALGLVGALSLFLIADSFGQQWSIICVLLGTLILINIFFALFASYLLYDKSSLYVPTKLLKDFEFKKDDRVMLLHASFDPVSPQLEAMFGSNLSVYNLYGNRHEHESAVKLSERMFPPHKKEVKIDPTKIPDKDGTFDYIMALTSAHEILAQEDRVKFFKEANRVLKKDGTIVLCEQMRNLINFIFFNIGAFHFVPLTNWKSAIRMADLEITKSEAITIWGTKLYIKKSKRNF